MAVGKKGKEPIAKMTHDELDSKIARRIATTPGPLPKAIATDIINAGRRLEVTDELILSDRAIAYLKTKLGL